MRRLAAAYGITKIRDYKEAALCRSLFAPVQPPALVYVQEMRHKKKKSAGNPPHGRVIWALCSDAAHEGRAYLRRAHQRSSYRLEEEAEEEGRGDSATSIDVLRTVHVFADAFTPPRQAIKTPQCCHAKCISISSAGLCVLQRGQTIIEVVGVLPEL